MGSGTEGITGCGTGRLKEPLVLIIVTKGPAETGQRNGVKSKKPEALLSTSRSDDLSVCRGLAGDLLSCH